MNAADTGAAKGTAISRIGLLSPQQISAWANKILPNGEIVGEVTKPNTFH